MQRHIHQLLRDLLRRFLRIQHFLNLSIAAKSGQPVRAQQQDKRLTVNTVYAEKIRADSSLYPDGLHQHVPLRMRCHFILCNFPLLQQRLHTCVIDGDLL